jgi:hypothetical protein
VGGDAAETDPEKEVHSAILHANPLMGSNRAKLPNTTRPMYFIIWSLTIYNLTEFWPDSTRKNPISRHFFTVKTRIRIENDKTCQTDHTKRSIPQFCNQSGEYLS